MLADTETELRKSLDHYKALTEQLQQALVSRVAIEQAKGVLAERYQVDVDEAFILLRTYCRSNNLKLTEAACALIRRESHRAAS
ncbi:MAG: ANTAR domain-containing protein [Haloechinothrix sp.]